MSKSSDRAGTMPLEDQMRRSLHAAGLRATPTRVRCLLTIVSADHQLTRREISQAFGSAGVDRVTLYRTLRALEEAGLVERHDRAGEAVWCSHVGDRGQRLFLVCRRCGFSTRIESGVEGVARRLARFAEPAGFELDTRHIEVTGLCESCRRAAE